MKVYIVFDTDAGVVVKTFAYENEADKLANKLNEGHFFINEAFIVIEQEVL